jgi:cytochrome c oxidase subunit 1
MTLVLPRPALHPDRGADVGAHAAADYTLPLPAVSSEAAALARGWLALGLAALLASGVLSLLLVLARTPGVGAWLPAGDFFRTVLVVHVDLSVLVWFSAMAGALWSLQSRRRGLAWGWVALGLAGGGTVLMTLATFVWRGTPLMANYIPVLDGPLFRNGLVLFGAGAAVLVLRTLAAAPPIGTAIGGAGALRFGLNAAAIAAAVALIAFAWSCVVVPRGLDARAYYEILFWGGGHALQFTWMLLMLVGWLALAQACSARLLLSPRVAVLLFAIGLVGVFATPYAYLVHPVASVEHREWHTWAMRFGGGLAVLPVALAVLPAWRPRAGLRAEQQPLRAALVASMLLFAAGGVIGFAIRGSNVRIPAHYHGCIVGVTLALMGLVYHLLPRLGRRAPQGRLAVAQPLVYGAGQLIHIAGLVWSGGYGVQRKVAGGEQALRSLGEIAGMGLMGLGGLVAIGGGLMFALVVWRALKR